MGFDKHSGSGPLQLPSFEDMYGLKHGILQKLKINKDPKHTTLLLRSGAGTDTEFLYDVASIQDGDHLIAIVELGSDNQEASVNYVSDTEAWLLTGHHTRGFKVLDIRENNAAPEEWVTLQRSSFLKGEHKFAIVGKEPGAQKDRRRWCARLYQLEQTENATLKIK